MEKKSLKKSELPLISIVIVDYDGKKFLKQCFDSLLNLNYPKNNIEMIMIENSSNSSPIEFVRKNYPKVKIIINKEDNYALANNIGTKQAKGDFVALVSNDVKFEKDWLIELVKVISSDKNIGAVGGKILLKSGKIQSVGHEEYPNFYWGDIGFNEIDKGQYNELMQRPSLCGVATLFRKKCLEDVGYFDESFIMYLEDVEFALRARKKAWKFYYVPNSVVQHEYMGTNTKETEKKFIERNRLLLIAKHFPEDLSNAISTSQFFYIEKNYDHLFDVLPLTIEKLIMYHKSKSNQIIEDLFKNLRKIIKLEKNALIIDSELRNDLLKRDKLIDSLKDELIKQKQVNFDLIKEQKTKNLELSNSLKLSETKLNETLNELSQERLKRDHEVNTLSIQLKHETDRLSEEFKSELNRLNGQLIVEMNKSEKLIEQISLVTKKSVENENSLIEQISLVTKKSVENEHLVLELKKEKEYYKNLLNKKVFELNELKKSILYKLILKPVDGVYRKIFPRKDKFLKSN